MKADQQQTNQIIKSARNSLLSYIQLFYPGHKTPPHIVKIAKYLRAVECGKIDRLIITVPPRHGKSMLCSQFFPGWYLGRNPEKYIIAASYGQELANDFGRKVKEQFQDPLFNHVFPECKVKRDTQSVNRLGTESGGTYFAVGVGGPAIGRGAHLFLIDDPIKNRQDAESPQMIKQFRDWYKSVARTRLQPGGAIVVIMQRWNNSDPVAWLEKDSAHENWLKIDLPAILPDGSPLWADQFSIDDLEKIKKAQGPYDWQSQYMQQPFDAQSKPFRSEWIEPHREAINHFSSKITFVDPAISEKQTADETALVTVGCESNTGIIYDVEVAHGRWSFDSIKENVRASNSRQQNRIYIENVQAQDWLVQDLAKEGLEVEGFKPDRDKIRKAMAIQDLFETGRVRVNNPELRRQLLEFPNGTHDDIADAFISAIFVMKERNMLEIKQAYHQWHKQERYDVDKVQDQFTFYKNYIDG